MLFQEYYLYNSFVLVLNILTGLDLLQKLSGLAIKLSHIPCSITQKELPAFVPKLRGRYVGLKGVLIKFRKHVHQCPSYVVVDSDVVGCEHENVVGHGTYLELEDVVKLVDLF